VIAISALAPAATLVRGTGRRVATAEPFLLPVAALLVAVTLLDAGLRLLALVGLPVLVIGAVAHRLPRSLGAAVALLLGVVTLSSGLIVSSSSPVSSRAEA
jgi:hypothetical protein